MLSLIPYSWTLLKAPTDHLIYLGTLKDTPSVKDQSVQPLGKGQRRWNQRELTVHSFAKLHKLSSDEHTLPYNTVALLYCVSCR